MGAVLQVPSHFGLLRLLTASPHLADPLAQRSGAARLTAAPAVFSIRACHLTASLHLHGTRLGRASKITTRRTDRVPARPARPQLRHPAPPTCRVRRAPDRPLRAGAGRPRA